MSNSHFFRVVKTWKHLEFEIFGEKNLQFENILKMLWKSLNFDKKSIKITKKKPGICNSFYMNNNKIYKKYDMKL